MTTTDSEPLPEEAAPAIDAGNYEVLRRRLGALGEELEGKVEALNAARRELFGGAEVAVVGSERVRTKNACVPRDVVSVGGYLLIGADAFLGLKAERQVGDVFGLWRFERSTHGGINLFEVPLDSLHGFLDDPRFVKDFKDLFQYYQDARLAQLRADAGKLLAVFRVGASARDLRVFRWRLDEGRPAYVDARGEDDLTLPPQHDFAWTETTRADHVAGRHPHVSVLDEVFVETVGGDLTIKVEDNTEDGRGIYREPVFDAGQSLEDAAIHYARVGGLVLLRIQPFRETAWRTFVFDPRARRVARVDAIGRACVALPEEQGVLFPGGYALAGEGTRILDREPGPLDLERTVRAPNGEDVLYVFHDRVDGRYVLYPYNLIRKEVAAPLRCHGWTLYEDGTLVVLRVQGPEPSRVHPIQVWQTPFASADYAADDGAPDTFLGTVGNAELVRGISDLLALRRLLDEPEVSRGHFEELIARTARVADTYFWLDRDEVGGLGGTLEGIRENGELIVDEFEKVVALRAKAAEALDQAQAEVEELAAGLEGHAFAAVEPLMEALQRVRTQRGHLVSLREMRGVDAARLAGLEERVAVLDERLGREAIQFLLRDEALAPVRERVEGLEARAEAAERATDLAALAAEVEQITGGLDVLTEVVGGLEVDDATERTRVLEQISTVFARVNRVRALVVQRRSELLSSEGQAEFAAQFRLFTQAVSSALAVADTPERCDEQLSRVTAQLEELETRFGELEGNAQALAEKREEVYEAFDARRQALADERQRRARELAASAERVVDGVARRAGRARSLDELNGFFAADPLVLKLKRMCEELAELGEAVRAEELRGKLEAARQEAARQLKDRLDLYAEGGDLIQLGRHRFGVNTRPMELTLVPAGDGLALHLTGTDFHEPIDDPEFLAAAAPFRDQLLVSESPEVYRAEFLAASILAEADAGRGRWSLDELERLAGEPEGLVEVTQAAAAERYDEGYERGLHDADAAHILAALLELRREAGLLRYGPTPRAWACLFWAHHHDGGARARWQRRAASLGRLRRALGARGALEELARELGAAVADFLVEQGLGADPDRAPLAGRYLVEELAAADPPRFTTSAEAVSLGRAFTEALDRAGERERFEADLLALEGRLSEQLELARAWLDGFLAGGGPPELGAARDETAALFLTEGLPRATSQAPLEREVEGLLGQHPRVRERRLALRLDAFLERLDAFRERRVPAFRDYRRRVRELLERERARLRIDELRPRVLASFVRNRLIDEVYLPLVGDNLAKQIGAAGAGKRTDLMGLLLLVSPPGYGKTTLMEYVASRLGLAFVKVNGPSLGHAVTSLDPAEAPNATARQEVEKIGLALEMAQNAMLYLDDIQHTHPELLQKFISLCDGQRRIEGVWRGRSRTYDLRGKRFCVVMAGNPYTESGERFQIPDMLANRADVYNLGDVLEGKEEQFAVSYLENALTSNPILAPIAARDPADVLRLVRMAQGHEVSPGELSHPYSRVELDEVLAVLRHLIRARDVLLRVNRLYITSASQDDAFRTEPPFKLQGSYRNMNKIAEKVSAAMNEAELERVVDDHYQGEAQTLTSGAEQNLLKLAELRGRLTPEATARWAEIKKSFQRIQLVGGADDDPVTRVTGQLSGLNHQVEALRDALVSLGREGGGGGGGRVLEKLEEVLRAMARERDGVGGNAQAAALERALRPVAEEAARGIHESREQTRRLGKLVEDYLAYERARRVRLQKPRAADADAPAPPPQRPSPAPTPQRQPPQLQPPQLQPPQLQPPQLQPPQLQPPTPRGPRRRRPRP